MGTLSSSLNEMLHHVQGHTCRLPEFGSDGELLRNVLLRIKSLSCSWYLILFLVSIMIIWLMVLLIKSLCFISWSGGCLGAGEPIRTCSSQGGTGNMFEIFNKYL